MGSILRARITIAAMSAAALSLFTVSSPALASEALSPPFDFEGEALAAPFELAVDFAIHSCGPQGPGGARAIDLPPFDFASDVCAPTVRPTDAPPFVL